MADLPLDSREKAAIAGNKSITVKLIAEVRRLQAALTAAESQNKQLQQENDRLRFQRPFDGAWAGTI